MAIPDYQTFMLPLLRLIGDRGELTIGGYTDALADEFNLSGEDREKLLPSGRTPVYRSRIGWAGTYLVKAGLLERPKRGTLKITPRGREVLHKQPDRIDNDFLDHFEEFRQFRTRSNDTPKPKPQTAVPTVDVEPELTPDEQLFESYRDLRRSLAQDLLTQIKSAPPPSSSNS